MAHTSISTPPTSGAHHADTYVEWRTDFSTYATTPATGRELEQLLDGDDAVALEARRHAYLVHAPLQRKAA